MRGKSHSGECCYYQLFLESAHWSSWVCLCTCPSDVDHLLLWQKSQRAHIHGFLNRNNNKKNENCPSLHSSLGENRNCKSKLFCLSILLKVLEAQFYRYDTTTILRFPLRDRILRSPYKLFPTHIWQRVIIFSAHVFFEFFLFSTSLSIKGTYATTTVNYLRYNLVPRVCLPPTPWNSRGGKKRDPGNEVAYDTTLTVLTMWDTYATSNVIYL